MLLQGTGKLAVWGRVTFSSASCRARPSAPRMEPPGLDLQANSLLARAWQVQNSKRLQLYTRESERIRLKAATVCWARQLMPTSHLRLSSLPPTLPQSPRHVLPRPRHVLPRCFARVNAMSVCVEDMPEFRGVPELFAGLQSLPLRSLLTMKRQLRVTRLARDMDSCRVSC